MVESASVLRTDATTIVPAGTRMSGAGISGARSGSANAGTSIAGPLSPSGRQEARRTSSRSSSVSPRIRPAGTRLSFGWTGDGPSPSPAGGAVGR